MFIYLIALCLLTANSCFSATVPQEKEIFFKNPLIHTLDAPKFGGTTIGIDGPTIHDMLWLIKEMKVMVQGAADRNAPIVKKYSFEGKQYTLGELVKLETTFTPKQQQAFEETLHIARRDFEVKTHVFLIQIRLLKTLVIDLIEEWCETSQKPDSFLRVWGKLPDDEFNYFHEHVTTARQLVQFMGDLKDFLTKMIQSCPHAWAEFEANQKEYNDKKKHH